MKAIQISMDESLLAQLDADEEVKRDGRSAVFRRAVSSYLRNRRANAGSPRRLFLYLSLNRLSAKDVGGRQRLALGAAGDAA